MTKETQNLIFAMAHYALSQPKIKEVHRIKNLLNRVILQTREQRRVLNSVIFSRILQEDSL